MRIAFCVIATGKYTCFVEPLWSSARRWFLPDHDRTLFLFSDASEMNLPETILIPTHHRPWPGPTLFRYEMILAAREILATFDFIYYCDADMLFVDTVGEEVLSELVGTLHPGFYQTDVDDCTYERDNQSEAYVPAGSGSHYSRVDFKAEMPPFTSRPWTRCDKRSHATHSVASRPSGTMKVIGIDI